MEKDQEKIVFQIARRVSAAGGRAYYVGGFVRDQLMNSANTEKFGNSAENSAINDVDIEIHGIEPDKLKSILGEIGDVLEFGKSFGIFSMAGYNVDIALPRKDRQTGAGHRELEVEVDPFLPVEKSCRRRDFTINAMMMDVLTGEILDFYGGREDLNAGVIRHVDDRSFPEDPLRVLRAAQFAARFDFTIAPETLELCPTVDLRSLSPQRVEDELRKALVRGKKPSVFFQELRKMNQLEPWFTELSQLIGLQQDPVFHPEGDVWNHTMEVLDRAAVYRNRVEEPFGFMLLCLTHDFGKILTTEVVKGRIHAYRHEVEGLPLIRDFLDRIVGEKKIKQYVTKMVPAHMKPNVTAFSRSSVKTTNRMFDSVPAPEDLIWMAMADKPVMAGNTPFSGDLDFLQERLEIYREIMDRPWITGRDLIDKGLEPGEDFGKILEHAHKLRLAGIEKDEALKQTLGFARTLRKKTNAEKQ